MEVIAWHQVFSNYHNLSFQPNGKTERLRIKQNLAGKKIRVELSNQYDPVPLKIESIKVSLTHDFTNTIALTLNAQEKFTIPTYQKLWTDSIVLEIPQGADLFFEIEVSNEKNLLATSANLFSQEIVHTNIQKETTFVYGLTSVVIETNKVDLQTMSIGFFGDSLTNQAYFSDNILKILYETDLPFTGFNAGISGNRLLLHGTADSQWRDSFGAAGINRFREDIISYHPNIVLSLIGVNDLFHPGTGSPISELPSARQMIDGYQRLYNEASANNIQYIGLTIPPFADSINHEKAAWNMEKEKIRLEVNDWLLNHSTTIDLAKLIANHNNPQLLEKTFDCGDHLHFSANGGKMIGQFIAKELQKNIANTTEILQ